MEIEQVLSEAAAYNINLTQEQGLLFQKYFSILMSYNKRYNLTRIIEEEQVLEEHFLDPILVFAKGAEKGGEDLLDLGTGAGFPGIPLKIFMPELKLTLLDSSGKKIIFLEALLRELALKNATALKTRGEAYGQGEGRERHAWVTARAFAPLNVALEIALPLLKIGGVFWAFKGPNYKNELDEAEEILLRCGGRLHKILTYALSHAQKERVLLIFKKVHEADKRYPRKAGLPQKRPIGTK